MECGYDLLLRIIFFIAIRVHLSFLHGADMKPVQEGDGTREMLPFSSKATTSVLSLKSVGGHGSCKGDGGKIVALIPDRDCSGLLFQTLGDDTTYSSAPHHTLLLAFSILCASQSGRDLGIF